MGDLATLTFLADGNLITFSDEEQLAADLKTNEGSMVAARKGNMTFNATFSTIGVNEKLVAVAKKLRRSARRLEADGWE